MSNSEVQVEQSAFLLARKAASRRKFKYWTWWLPGIAVAWAAFFFTLFSEPLDRLAQNWPLIGVGFLGSTLGNATAVGGGLIFVPVFILIYKFPAVTALKIALASQCFGMGSGAIGWLAKGVVPRRALLIAIPPMLVGSTISSLIIYPNSILVKGLFGPVSILVGILTLYSLRRLHGVNEVPARAYLPLIGFSLIGGTLTGWIAIGEGEVIAAFLMLGYCLRADRAIGLGVVLLAINSIYLTLIHQIQLGGIPWEVVIFTAVGSAYGGRMGPFLANWVGPRRLKIGFGIVAIIDGIIFVIQFLKTGGG